MESWAALSKLMVNCALGESVEFLVEPVVGLNNNPHHPTLLSRHIGNDLQ